MLSPVSLSGLPVSELLLFLDAVSMFIGTNKWLASVCWVLFLMGSVTTFSGDTREVIFLL